MPFLPAPFLIALGIFIVEKIEAKIIEQLEEFGRLGSWQ